MKFAINFSRQIAVFCSTFLFSFCFAQLNGCSYSHYTQQQKSVLTQSNPLSQNSIVATKNNVTKKAYVIKGKRYYVLNNAQKYHQIGTASWYGKKFQGHRTSNHERYNSSGMTAASPVLPLATYVKVTNLTNGKQIVVKINDRGPFRDNRILDLSFAAATKLGFAHQGLTKVEVEAIEASNNVSIPNKNFHEKYNTYPELVANNILQET